jgi:hypothetical protein
MKPFDPTLYAANDDAKYLAIDLLERNGWDATVNPDQYGIDIVAWKEKETLSLEVEVKHNWTGEVFPYDTVQIPVRKRKFAQLPDSWFILINSDRTHGLMTSGHAVMLSNVITVSNKYVKEGEEFFSIPLSAFTLVKMKGN